MPAGLTLRETAERLGVHYMTAYRYVRLGMLPATKEAGRWRVLRRDVERFRSSPSSTRGGAPWAIRLRDRMLASDEAGAWSVVAAALVSGLDAPEIHTEVLIPALDDIGRQWEAGVISVADEHAASRVAERLVGRLSSLMARRGVSKGTIVLGGTSYELHGLPAAIAADLFRNAGYDVVELGVNLPAGVFSRRAAEADRLVAVGVSVTSPGQSEAVRETVDELRRRIDAPVLLGGGGLDTPAEAISLGADGWARDAMAGIAWLQRRI